MIPEHPCHKLFIGIEHSRHAHKKYIGTGSIPAQQKMTVKVQTMILKLIAVQLPADLPKLWKFLAGHFYTVCHQIVMKWLAVRTGLLHLLPPVKSRERSVLRLRTTGKFAAGCVWIFARIPC